MKALHTQDVTNPVSLPSFHCSYDISLFLASCDTSSYTEFKLRCSIIATHQARCLDTDELTWNGEQLERRRNRLET
jgi:hypothetical protein